MMDLVMASSRSRSRSRSHRQLGFTLIELMVAMLLGLLVSAGIITVFASTSSNNKAQTQLARLQEEGRFAITRLSSDLSMANGQYCTNSGGTGQTASGGLILDGLRTPNVYASNLIGAAGAVSGALSDVTTAWGAKSGSVTYPAAPTAAYSMPSFLFMRGYDCTATTCTPVDPTTAGLPAMGTAVGNRVEGAAVITVRYVNPSSGWSIGSTGGSTIASSGTTSVINSITLKPLAGEPPASNFTSGDVAMLANCSNAQIFAATGSPTLTPDISKNFTSSSPVAQPPSSSPKLFDVNRDFQTVTYYLKVVSVNNNGTAPLTGALIRRVNGGLGAPAGRGPSEDELVRGIERMDFQYGVQDASGNFSFVAASDIDTSTSCPPAEINPITTTGCGWRSVNSIQVSILMDGQIPLYTLSANDLNYVYNVDGNVLEAPSKHTPYTPTSQGFTDQMIRREFTALVALRNYNP